MSVCHSYRHRARRASFKQRPHRSAASWLDRGGVHMLIPATRRLDRNESQKQKDAQRPTLMEANMLVRSECDTQNIERNGAKTHIMDMYGDVMFCPPHIWMASSYLRNSSHIVHEAFACICRMKACWWAYDMWTGPLWKHVRQTQTFKSLAGALQGAVSFVWNHAKIIREK